MKKSFKTGFGLVALAAFVGMVAQTPAWAKCEEGSTKEGLVQKGKDGEKPKSSKDEKEEHEKGKKAD